MKFLMQGLKILFCTTSLFVLTSTAMQQPKMGDRDTALQAYRKNRDTILELLVDGHRLIRTESEKDALLIQCRNKYEKIAREDANEESASRVQSILLSGMVGIKCLYKWYTNTLTISDCARETQLLSIGAFCCWDSCQRRYDVESCEDAIMTINAVIRQKSGLIHPHRD